MAIVAGTTRTEFLTYTRWRDRLRPAGDAIDLLKPQKGAEKNQNCLSPPAKTRGKKADKAIKNQ
jgi:hypothetical protein